MLSNAFGKLFFIIKTLYLQHDFCQKNEKMFKVIIFQKGEGIKENGGRDEFNMIYLT
jgi:hypothetical protein